MTMPVQSPERENARLKEYIEHLEHQLTKAGYRKVCSCCTLACIPIWSNSHPPGVCEVCDEVSKETLCATCNGRGHVVSTFGHEVTCYACDGDGKGTG